MNRTLALVGAAALAVALPVVTLAAPTGGSAHARPAAGVPGTAAHVGSSERGDFKTPRVDLEPKSLSGQHFALKSPAAFELPPPSSLSHRWYGWQSSPGYLGYPPLFGGTCYGNSAFAGTSGAESFDTTLGSLVDGKSNLLSAPSYGSSGAALSNNGAASSLPVTVQVGTASTECGGPGLTNFQW